jgi:hypothetical protein
MRAMNIQIVIETQAPHELAEWWANALGWLVEYPDEKLVNSLIDQGLASDDDRIVFHGRRAWRTASALHQEVNGAPTGARIYVRGVRSEKIGRNRLHWDVEARPESIDDVVARLVSLGATRLGESYQGPHRSVQMVDIHNNEFCVH